MAALKPDERLIGVRAKIERAKQLVREFEEALQSFRGTNPYGVVAENNAQTGDRIYTIKTRTPIPLELPLIAGLAIHQLRSSLDHLAWQLVEANGHTPGKWTYFPISENKSKYIASSDKVQGMSAGAIKLIDAAKPYQGGNDALWALHELDNIDKHRFLLVTAFGAAEPIVRLTKGRFGGSHVVIKIHDGLSEARQRDEVVFLEDGAEIGRVVGCGESEVYTNLDVSFEIAFGEPQVVRGKPVLPFLHQVSHLVGATVDQFIPVL
jgi:hypothetical protein